ncbi:hypothetical protein [Sphingobacterium bambusae]|uniref:Uncharacterized protein n=1 Tax=Sphingobacterium bambusae TaxID=662858 RepID=A0ABW6BA15_9SPHI|nr:hypothetical protein [Sphingobacterium bambusae]WPL48548.1 hypothetical protein SCB77_21605 [Sphingobacterium bambusae]
MKTNIFLLAILLLASSCSGLKNYSSGDNPKIVSEKTTLTITPIGAKSKNQMGGIAGIAAIIGPSLIDLGVKSVQQKLKSDALKYTGSYKASNSAQNFRTSAETINLPKLTISRNIVLEKDAETGTTTPAISFELIPEQSDDQTAFRYMVNKDTSSFKYNYSIAKLKGNSRFVDLTVEIKVKSLSLAAGEYKLNDIRTVSMNIPMVRVGEPVVDDKIYSGWIPILPKSVVSRADTSDTRDTTITIKTEGKKPPVQLTEELIKKSVITQKPQALNVNSGLYEIEVVVTEVNPAKIKAAQRAAFVDATSESGTSVLKSILEVLTKEKETDKETEAKE